jgi:hypothetical protein
MVADSQGGNIGELSGDIYTEYGNNIIRTFTTATIFNNCDSFSGSEVELLMESGTGNSDEPDPQIRMSVSDNAYTFSDPITSAVGRVGEYQIRQIWRRLGRFRRYMIMKFEFSSPCKFAAIKLMIRVRQGHNRG